MQKEEVCQALDEVLGRLYVVHAQTQRFRFRSGKEGVKAEETRRHFSILERMEDKQLREIECIGLLFRKMRLSPQGSSPIFGKIVSEASHALGQAPYSEVITDLIESHEKVVEAATKVQRLVREADPFAANFAYEQSISHQNDMDRLKKMLSQVDVSMVVKKAEPLQ